MLTAEQSEQVRIWPMKVHLREKVGYSLWASGEHNELVLALDGRVLLCRTPTTLRDVILAADRVNLASLTGYAALRALWSGATAPFARCPVYNFNHLMRLLADSDRSRWHQKTRAAILDGLNLLADLAYTIGDPTMIQRIHGHTQLHALADLLTFATGRERHTLLRFNRADIVASVDAVVSAMHTNALLIASHARVSVSRELGGRRTLGPEVG